MKDSTLRIVVKGLTWRLIAVAITLLLVWLFTGNIALAGEIAAIDFLIKWVLYCTHDRLWSKCHWGTGRRTCPACKKTGFVQPYYAVDNFNFLICVHCGWLGNND